MKDANAGATPDCLLESAGGTLGRADQEIGLPWASCLKALS